MSAKLKPCPFCGHSGELRSTRMWPLPRIYWVACTWEPCPMLCCTPDSCSEAMAIYMWNLRPEQREEVK